MATSSDGDGLYFGPCLNPGADARPLSDQEVTAFRERFLAAVKAGGQPRLLTPLPRRVRLRLAVEQAVTDAGIWLCDHRMWWAADLLWWRR